VAGPCADVQHSRLALRISQRDEFAQGRFVGVSPAGDVT
jgi:hypothetical protein